MTKKLYNNFVLKLSAIKLNYHGQTALKIDEFSASESFAVVGCAGSGKSSFLKTIAGLERIESGYIYVDGKEVGELMPKQRNLSLICARTPLKKSESVYKNLVYPLKKHHYSKEQVSAAFNSVLHILLPNFLNDAINLNVDGIGKIMNNIRVDNLDAELACAIEIKKLLSKKVKDLSPEQQARVLLARAMIRKPKLILVDEPSEIVDDTVLFCRLLQESKAKFILATYDFSLAERVADRFVILKDGEIIFDGDKGKLADCENPYITKMCF